MDRDQIRKNRQRIRKQMKACFVTPADTTEAASETVDIKKVQQQNYVKNRNRRKTSQDVRISDDISFLKEMYISNSFNQLFEIKEKIGQGAQSAVYTCKQIDTDSTFAVKKINIKDPQLARKQKEQFKILKTFDHQNIIKAYYLFINEIESTCYLVLQHCSYGSLKDFLQTNPMLKQAQVAQIIKQILNALIYIHKNHACHRDIKPQNILYNHQTGQLKLIDFQIAKITKYEKDRLQMWTKTSTPQYKAPQMFLGQYNQQIDIWALGVVAYEMLFKKLPFNSEYESQLQKKIIQQQPNYNTSKVTQAAINFIKRLLQKNPLSRLTAAQVLKTPFLLKYISNSGSASPCLKNGSEQDKHQIKERKQCFFALKPCHDDQSSKLNAHISFSVDIGIRVVDSKRVRRNTIIECENVTTKSQYQLDKTKQNSESPSGKCEYTKLNEFPQQLQEDFCTDKQQIMIEPQKPNNRKSQSCYEKIQKE